MGGTMPQELINILIQLPVVALFLWYSERMYNRFETFLSKESDKREQQSNATLIVLQGISKQISDYHSAVNEGIAVMEERTRPRDDRK